MPTFKSAHDWAGNNFVDEGGLAGPVSDRRFLERQTAGSILRNVFAIYFGNWWPICKMYLILLLPIVTLHAVLVGLGLQLYAEVFELILMLVSLLGGAVITVMVSDLCLGFRPSVGRSFRRGFANAGPLLGTYLLAFAAIFGGAILLAVPGLIFSAWFMFVIEVVVLEQLRGRAAMRRSRELGKQSYLRNLGLVVLFTVPLEIISFICGFIIGIMTATENFVIAGVLDFAFTTLTLVLISPMIAIAGILIYYDMRVRKEGYAVTQLTEDLKI